MKSVLMVKLIRLLSLFPLPVLRAIGVLVGELLWLFNGRNRKVTEDNIRACFPDLGTDEQTKLARESVRELGIMGMELGPAWCWSSEQLLSKVVAVEGLEHLQQAMDKGTGSLLLAPHLGNWEVLGVYLGQHFATTSLYQPPKYPAMDKMIYAARERTGATLVPTNTSGVKSLLKALKRGDLVAILPDQRPDPSGGEFAPFYGHQVLTMTLAHNLAKRTGAQVVSGVARRVAGGKFIIRFSPVEPAIYSEDMGESLAALNRSVEACISSCPAQYQWEYKRLKAQPDGQKWPYR